MGGKNGVVRAWELLGLPEHHEVDAEGEGDGGTEDEPTGLETCDTPHGIITTGHGRRDAGARLKQGGRRRPIPAMASIFMSL